MSAVSVEQLRADLAARDALLAEYRAYLSEADGHRNCVKALLARTPADAGAELARLRKDRDDAIHERNCCHEIYDSIRRSLGYPDGTGYPMLAPEVAKVIAERDALRAQLASAEAEKARLAELGEKWAIDARDASERAEAAEARLRAVTDAADEVIGAAIDAHDWSGTRLGEAMKRYDAARAQAGKEGA